MTDIFNPGESSFKVEETHKYEETSEKYENEITINPNKYDKYHKQKLDLTKAGGFKHGIFDIFQMRKHILYYSIKEFEKPIEVVQSINTIHITLITKREVREKINQLKDGDKIGWIYIGKIQILIKSAYKKGMNSPIQIAVLDNRKRYPSERMIGMIEGNLGYGMIKFQINPQFSIYMKDTSFDKAITLVLKRK